MNLIVTTQDQLTEIVENATQKAFDKFLVNKPQESNEPLRDRVFMKDACRITNLKKATIYVLVSQNKIPFFKPEGVKMLMFSRTELSQWLEAGRPANKI